MDYVCGVNVWLSDDTADIRRDRKYERGCRSCLS